jgi:hypothetical protein
MSNTSFWRCFHWFAMQDFKESFNLEKFMDKLRHLYKNDIINTEWEVKLDNEDYIDWSLRLHNKTNAYNNQYSKWDRIDFFIAQKKECDICADKEFLFFFPWVLMYKIAVNVKNESDKILVIEMLIELNKIYPCDTCKGTFLTDLPQQDEQLKDWVLRNHKRFNLSRNRPENYMVPIDILDPTVLAQIEQINIT